VDWRSRLVRGIRATDLLVLSVAVYGAQLAWLGSLASDVTTRSDSRIGDFSYGLLSAMLLATWMWALGLFDSRSERAVGSGSLEYRAVVEASMRVFGSVAIVAFLLRVDVARGYLLVSLPTGLSLLLVSRWLWRQWLTRQRRQGRYCARVVLVGSEGSVAQIARELERAHGSGYLVVSACLPRANPFPTHVPGTDIPVLGTLDDVDAVLRTSGADTVAITSTDELPPFRVKQISWSLEAGRQHLVLAPSIIDIAGPRIHTRPAAGLPLIHVETPRMSQSQRFVKRAVDVVASTAGVLALAPLLVVLAVLVKRSGPGPVLFRQVRVGQGGRTFEMLKFRSMVNDAADLLPSLLDVRRDSGNEILFKLRNDPRVTPIGRVMRRFSLDELPQLFNVMVGTMSLVGQRPPLTSEVAQYADHVHRRFLVKPGMTGLWQVSGRSTLSWDDTVRLDLSYVENYSFVSDLLILGKTIRAVVDPGESAH
jgi:exopolysaccharide biosynthesis polyprenyl glycosylphosphotransferase